MRDLTAAIADGAVTEMSFAFRITDGQWSPDYTEYRINAVDLDRGDVSAVTYGANPHTSIEARAASLLAALDHMSEEQARGLCRGSRRDSLPMLHRHPRCRRWPTCAPQWSLTARPIPNDYPRSMRVICAAYRASDARPVALPDGAQR